MIVGMMVQVDDQEVLAVVRRAVAQVLEIDPSAISRQTAFVADLKADSLALVELVEILEERLGDGLHIPDEAIDRLVTVGDAVDYVRARLGAGPL